MAKDYKELTEHVEKLNSLLKDPQEGLFTWNNMVHERWQKIAELWTGEKENDQKMSNFKMEG